MSLTSRVIFATLAALFAVACAELPLRLVFPPERFVDPTSEAYRRATVYHAGEVPPGANIEPDPKLGWRMKRNYRSASANHNSRGFRGTREYAARAERRRILVLGDSFTYGLNVDDDATYTAQLGKLLDAQAINAGVNGYGVGQALLMWETEGRSLRPDRVVLGYFTDDFHRNAFRIGVLSKPRFVLAKPGGPLVYEAPSEPERRAARRSRAVDLLRLSSRRLKDRFGSLPVSMLRARQAVSERLLRRLRDSVSAAGADLVVLIIPHCAYPEDGHYGPWIVERITESCASLGLTCVDFTDMTDAELYEGCHWNEAGHRRAAERIARRLPSGNAQGRPSR